MSAYVPVGWTAFTLLSGKNFNQMANIHDCAKGFIDVHEHDSSYYTTTQITAKCFSGGALKPDADTVDSKHWDEIITDFMPIGFCCFWDGSIATIPSGWHECDGQTINGVVLPDMRGRIPLGAGSVYAALSSGGSASLATAGGTATVEGHTLTVAEIPSHYHKWNDYDNEYLGTYSHAWYGGGVGPSTDVSRTTEYNHSDADAAHDHSTKALVLDEFSIMPPWLAKVMICKVS